MKFQNGEKWALLGASSGFGKAFAAWADDLSGRPELFLMSRKADFSADFSKEADWPLILQKIRDFQPTRLFYFAGGGPWGNFQDKSWSSHLWTYRVNLLFPAFLIQSFPWSELKQAVFIGSAIAESKPDPQAAGYASAKHGLKGLILSVHGENKIPDLDLRLFSPGYLDTPLLPRQAWPRQVEGLVHSPHEAARALGAWIENVHSAKSQLIWP